MEPSPPYQARPYRSKRHRPCDVCRRRKQACSLYGSPPCRVCRELGTECTFNDPPSKRLRTEQQQQRAYAPSVIAHSSSTYSRPALRVQASRHRDPSTNTEGADEAVPSNVNGSHDERPNGEDDRPRSRPSGGGGGGGSGDAITANPVWTQDETYSTLSAAQVREIGMGSGVEPQDDSLGLLGECDVGSQMLNPIQYDMWYLASLWDSNFSGSILQPMSNGFAGNMNGSYQEGLFEMLDENPGSSNLPQSDLSRPQRSSVPKTNAVSNTNSRVPSIRSLDILDQGCAAQYIGLSGDIDPYLLQHARFSDDGTCDFIQFQYRRLAGCPSTEGHSHCPTHFVISPAKLSEDGITRPTPDQSNEMSLKDMISPEIGSRLVGLLVDTQLTLCYTSFEALLLPAYAPSSRFHQLRCLVRFLRYVFPGLPVLSRSRLKVRTVALIPEEQSLSTMPQYLLAAVYASVDSFRRYDPVVCMSQIDTAYNTSSLWKMAYRGIQQNMHVPQLAVLQTILIYLQRLGGRSTSAMVDIPGHWPMLGSAVNLAYQLGLHRECQTWSIPAWEKRLRRRLWWILYNEVTWRSLLLGLPHAISADQWDVSALGENDFLMEHLQCPTEETATQDPALQEPCQFCHGGYDFQYLASLSSHAVDVYRELYTLAATRRCAGDFNVSLSVGKRLLTDIRDWKRDLPAHMVAESQPPSSESRDYFHPGSATQIKLACLTLEVLIYRAMLRSLPPVPAGSASPRPAGAEARGEASYAPTHHRQGRPQDDISPVLETFRRAIDVVQRASTFAHRLGSYDRNSLFYSWARNSFAVISNFILFLLVQAPTTDLAKEVLTLLARWVVMLREQYILFDHMQLGLVRLDAVFRLGMEKALRFPPHVREAVETELPKRSYK